MQHAATTAIWMSVYLTTWLLTSSDLALNVASRSRCSTCSLLTSFAASLTSVALEAKLKSFASAEDVISGLPCSPIRKTNSIFLIRKCKYAPEIRRARIMHSEANEMLSARRRCENEAALGRCLLVQDDMARCFFLQITTLRTSTVIATARAGSFTNPLTVSEYTVVLKFPNWSSRLA
jgi:hypothetical protein